MPFLYLIGLGMFAIAEVEKNILEWQLLVLLWRLRLSSGPLWVLLMAPIVRRYLLIKLENTLAACEPNAILFVRVNDTFPLWYVQDVEGFLM
jgi:hypothetical protein